MSFSRNREVINAGPSAAIKSLVLLVVIVILAVIMLSSAFHIVPPGSRGIMITLGRVSPTFLHEGLNFKLPFVTRVQDMEIKQKTTQSHTEVFSHDLQNITVTYNVLYRIPEAKVVEMFQQFSGEPYQSLVDPRVQEILKQLTATYRAEELATNREKLKSDLVILVGKAMNDMVIISDITITNMQLSKPLEDAIEQKVIREQEALAKKFELDKAMKDAEITIVKAKAEAESVKIKGEALKSAPEVVNFEIATKWDGKAPQAVVTTTGGANVLLPLK
jgi:prohibitin 2